MLRTILISVFFSSLSVACKILPHSIRSELKGEEALGMLEQSSVQFVRQQLGTQGTLSFLLKDHHNCRVEYWAENPNGQPPPGSHKSIDCPNDGRTLAIKMPIDSIVLGIPLTFRFKVWPRTLTALNGFSWDYQEFQNLAKVSAAFLVVARYIAPRNSNEIYTFQFPKTTSLQEIEAKMSTNYFPEDTVSCSDKPDSTKLIFGRLQSVEDAQKRPLHGLSEVNTDGFGRAPATAHPFFSTRLMQFFEAVERRQNWRWNFRWEGQANTFESFPPGYLASLNLLEGASSTLLSNRLLGNVLPSVDTTGKSLRLTPSILYPTEISRFELTIKSADASKLVLRCLFTIDQETLTVPESYYQKIPVGEYLATLVFETNQIHIKEGAPYPPWLITTQDWVHFKVNKKL